ncbi:MAG: hypothetical protein ACRC3G_04250 [Bacteroidales bacterium]
MKEIIDWLKSESMVMREGVKLFETYASPRQKERYSSFFQKYIEAKTGTLGHNRLVSELKRAQNSTPSNIAQGYGQCVSLPEQGNKTSSTGSANSVQFEKIKAEDLPQELQSDFAFAKDITPQMAALHAKLKDESLPQEEAKRIAEELCEMDTERAEAWAEIEDHFTEKKQSVENIPVSEVPQEPVARGIWLSKKISLIEGYIGRDKKNLAEQTKPNIKAKIEVRIAEREKSLEAYKKLLNEHTGE